MDTITPRSLTPTQAWEPLPKEAWDAAAARHLLRRIGFTALPSEVDRALAEGLEPTLRRYFSSPTAFTPPRSVLKLEDEAPERTLRAASPEERRRMIQLYRERHRSALGDLSVRWLEQAARPEFSPYEKWVLFLQDVFVISAQRVQQAPFVFRHQDLLRRLGTGGYADLAKAVSRSPAMIIYLDLQQNKRANPNENFARELFELFLLGEGNYSEQDIKEAARAFTGYRQFQGEFRLLRNEVDRGRKTVFGKTGNWSGDDVIDIACRMPAAGTFLPKEMARFYLTDRTLPDEIFAPIGSWWSSTGLDLSELLVRFFSSRLFFAPEFRGNLIKSPVQFYLGLVQDLDLDVIPLPRYTLVPLRQMGQILYAPPNVRGWVGGRTWINASTLAGRRQLVEALFTPLNERTLNADEWIELVAARAHGAESFTLPPSTLRAWAEHSPATLAEQFVRDFLPEGGPPGYQAALAEFLGDSGQAYPQRIRNAAVTLLQSPEYQLC